MGKKKETQGLLDQKTRLIGIAAAGHSVGCTHFSIMLLNYLAGYRSPVLFHSIRAARLLL